MERSSKSKSFMREHELIGISNEEDEDDKGYTFDKNNKPIETHLDLEYYFQQRADSNKLLFNKKTLLKITHEKGMNRNVVVNALHLQDYPFHKIKQIIKDITRELKEARIKGVLEFHANDTTQSSYHFHFWTWKHYEERAREFLSLYMIENNYSSANNVKIEGVFNRDVSARTTNAEKKELHQKNIESKYIQEEEIEIPQPVEKRRRINELRSSTFHRVNSLSKKEEESRSELFKNLTSKTRELSNKFKEKSENINIFPTSRIYSTNSELEEINKVLEELRKKINLGKK